MSDDIYIEEVPEPKEEPGRLYKLKSWVKQYEVPLACAVTGVFVFGVTYRGLGLKIDELEFEKTRCLVEFNELYDEAAIAMEFIDTKNLREKYFAFAKEQYENAE